MKKVILSLVAVCSFGQLVQAFCGFYVAKAGAELYNNKSEVILVRDGKNSIITMSNDFIGDVKDFAMVIPVPNVLAREDIKVADRSVFSLLDAYSSPRLVEYFDQNPCSPPPVMYELEEDMVLESVSNVAVKRRVRDFAEYKVKVEARYNVEEYEIVLLSAKKSSGLKNWLIDNGYSIPVKAEHVLQPYIKSGLKFFVVKVNLAKYNPQANGGFLRPLQIKVKSDKFMLPIRLGMANAQGEQDMIVYAFSKKGRVECSNYKTIKMPTNAKVPTFVKPNFGDFYADVFRNEYTKQGRNAVFLEYAWNVSPSWGGAKCDPCVGNPPYAREFLMAGVPWVNSGGSTTFFTRMHVRYALDKFPEDLFFIETPNKEHYQARYVITNPATGDLNCDDGKKYMKKLKERRKEELQSLALLSQWDTDQFYNYIANGTDEIQINEQDKNTVIPIIPKLPGGSKGTHTVLIVCSLLLFTYVWNILKMKRWSSA